MDDACGSAQGPAAAYATKQLFAQSAATPQPCDARASQSSSHAPATGPDPSDGPLPVVAPLVSEVGPPLLEGSARSSVVVPPEPPRLSVTAPPPPPRFRSSKTTVVPQARLVPSAMNDATPRRLPARMGWRSCPNVT